MGSLRHLGDAHPMGRDSPRAEDPKRQQASRCRANRLLLLPSAGLWPSGDALSDAAVTAHRVTAASLHLTSPHTPPGHGVPPILSTGIPVALEIPSSSITSTWGGSRLVARGSPSCPIPPLPAPARAPSSTAPCSHAAARTTICLNCFKPHRATLHHSQPRFYLPEANGPPDGR